MGAAGLDPTTSMLAELLLGVLCGGLGLERSLGALASGCSSGPCRVPPAVDQQASAPSSVSDTHIGSQHQPASAWNPLSLPMNQSSDTPV